jgi:hypothetical protein
VRTTLTIDDDIARLVQEEVRRSGGTFKGTVNALLRRGLTTVSHPQSQKPLVVKPLFLGLRPEQNYDNVESLLEELEGPGHR